MIVLLASLIVLTLTHVLSPTQRFMSNLSLRIRVEGAENILAFSSSLMSLNMNLSTPKGHSIVNELAIMKVLDNETVLIEITPKLTNYLTDCSGLVIIKPKLVISNGRSYTLELPRCCFFSSSGVTTHRLVLNPGSDYVLSLIVLWEGLSNGCYIHVDYNIVLRVVRIYGPSKAYIKVIGIKPPNTEGWVVANGSSRTYSLLIDREVAILNLTDYTRFKVWIWVFDPIGHERFREFRIKLIDLQTGKKVLSKIMNIVRYGNYYEVLLELGIKPYRPYSKYRLYVTTYLNDKPVTLSVDVTIIPSGND